MKSEEPFFIYISNIHLMFRYSSSLLKRTVNSLSPYATQIIVNGKSLTVGTIKLPPVSFHKPMTPKEIHDALFNRVSSPFYYIIFSITLYYEVTLN